MDSCSIYYVEFGVKNGLGVARRLCCQYGFRPIATRKSSKAKQWALTSGSTRFLVTEPITASGTSRLQASDDSHNVDNLHTDPYFVSFCDGQTESSPGEHRDIRDSVFNVAFAVNDVLKYVQRLMQSGVQLIKPVSSLSDENGTVWTATVKSCVGNVVHTLVQKSDYSGCFLPGFTDINNEDDLFDCCDKNYSGSEKSSPNLTHIDHITFAAYCGSADEILHWYERCFGMKRFFINREEDENEGFVVDAGNTGLRLKAFEYWKCAEIGLTSGKANSIKFIIAEALSNQGPNQVDTFLSNHDGPGIQHIGLSSSDIVSSVSVLTDAGVQFVEPPYTYYTEIGKLKEITEIGENLDMLQKYGILVDAEADSGNSPVEPTSKQRYLLQKFTRPLFDRDTFFLEIIQREGATGFGAGNISALWRSVQAYLIEKTKNSDD
ncbi:4-hydroxyphenylpyruvate dioxygenase-like protein [Gigantopelta aegis]|uniref:4-hydroxyphenylpyruvate dioxygenase-like protein n=1 Tax=Gigantopelta aegis TaxID=1735272 RepID=UPI001B88D535|nr:4-hydroxyphenylpyruvate dioxygenase-like protein [Gigantopelta aegis]